MKISIPDSVIAVVSQILAENHTLTTLKGLFASLGAFGDSHEWGQRPSKEATATAWLKKINSEESPSPFQILGGLLQSVLEPKLSVYGGGSAPSPDQARQLRSILQQNALEYRKGGKVNQIHGLATPTRSLDQRIRERDLGSIHEEFERALEATDQKPRDAVSSASNILEAVCKVYIEDSSGLELPKRQDLKSVWDIVRNDLGFDPAAVEDGDLKKILSGLISIVQGLGAFRTHASTAHSPGRRNYRPQPRHARLAVHAANTVAVFILESWDQKSTGP